ncbi:hypothetical protein V2J09_009936 [Rumex salicifolius]
MANQEFVAHSRSVRCVSIGKKVERRLLLTGGDDHRVNVWRIGKPSPLTSLSGHSSCVECVAFDSAVISVLAGASSGALKLWDLEHSKLKILRTLTGHKLKCTAVDFHPFGELFATSSIGKNLKLWDIRKKGCIQTYKGHSLGINTLKFTPDGRWVVSGGLDSIVKVWDLTAGKLLHEFNFHDGPITSIEFHPLEFLLATGSEDRTVKFWDLETFEMIGSTRAEAAGVRAMSFHPDGRTLFCGYDESLKVHSWEPVVCHDSINMEWSTLGDLSIHEQRLIGCSYYRNSVGIWAADLSLIKPYGTSTILEDNCPLELKADIQENERPINSKNAAVVPTLTNGNVKISADRKVLNKVPSRKNIPAAAMSPKPIKHLTSKSFVTSSTLLKEISDVKDFESLRREPFSSVRASRQVPVSSFHNRTASDIVYDTKRPLLIECRSLNSGTETVSDGLAFEVTSKDSVEEKFPIVNTVEDNSKEDNPKIVKDSLDGKKQTKEVIKGGTIKHGRTRSLVERFEKWDKPISKEDKTVESDIALDDIVKSSNLVKEEPQISGRGLSSPNDDTIIEDLMQSHDTVLSDLRYRLVKLQKLKSFWEQNDYKGAINMMKKFPDYFVQADVIGIFMDKMEIITLDLFSCLLPTLVTLLDSQTERHAKMSLEMLLKLVALYGEMISSTISAPPLVGVDLHQEERIKCCRDCFNQLQKLQRTLDEITRRISGNIEILRRIVEFGILEDPLMPQNVAIPSTYVSFLLSVSLSLRLSRRALTFFAKAVKSLSLCNSCGSVRQSPLRNSYFLMIEDRLHPFGNFKELPLVRLNSLPRGIIHPRADLELRSLWSSSSSKVDAFSNHSLLAMAVGISQKDNRISQSYSFTTMEMWFAKRFLHPDVVNIYDYIFLWDEDLGVKNFHPGRYLDIVKSEELDISQPALDPLSTEIHHKITVRKSSHMIHRRMYSRRGPFKCSNSSRGPPCAGYLHLLHRWVEVMAPVFSRASWRCAWHLIQNDLVHGWGLDIKIGYCAQGDRMRKVGIVDSEYIVHQGVQTLGGSSDIKASESKKSHKRRRPYDNRYAVSLSNLIEHEAEIRRQATLELETFKERWEKAVKEDTKWVDPYLDWRDKFSKLKKHRWKRSTLP